jgi:hypothetical protein
MNVIKVVLIYVISILLPFLVISLFISGIFRSLLLVILVFTWFVLFYLADKFILFSLRAREVTDADQQELFQALKGQTYRNHLKLPRVYLYTGHRLKSFVLDQWGSNWTIILDRKLIKQMNKEQIDALVRFVVRYKQLSQAVVPTYGMGVLSFYLRFFYWFWTIINIFNKKRFLKTGIFISLMFLKPLIELILWLSKNTKSQLASESIKSIFYQLDKDVTSRSFMEFMMHHLDTDLNINEFIIEFVEQYPMLENCSFKEIQ